MDWSSYVCSSDLAIFVIREPIRFIQLIEPRQCLRGVAGSILQQLHEEFQQLVEPASRQGVRYIFREMIAAHRGVTPFYRFISLPPIWNSSPKVIVFRRLLESPAAFLHYAYAIAPVAETKV